MPVKHPCSKCRKACKHNPKVGEESICCDKCERWVHFLCTGLTNEDIECYQNNGIQFICERCKNTCLICKKYCRWNQKIITCCNCNQNVHEKCRDPHFGILLSNPGDDSPNFYCDSCSPPSGADETLTPSLPNLDNSSSTSSDTEFSDAHSSDFEWESVNESDDELRGLNFASLPVQSGIASVNRATKLTPRIGIRTVKYKYPCNICHGPCKENVQDSIQCTWCDEWIH